jgi:hypothetical protein
VAPAHLQDPEAGSVHLDQPSGIRVADRR